MKYKFERRARAVFDGVSVIVRTYCGCSHALRQSAKVKYKSDGRASGCKCKSEVLSLSTKCNRERASLRASAKTKCKTYNRAGLATLAGIYITPSLPWNYTGFLRVCQDFAATF